MGVPCRPSSVDVSHIAIVSPAHLGLRARPSTEERTAPTQRTGRARGCQIKIRRRGTGCTMRGSKQENRRLPSTPQLDSASIRSFQWFSWRGRGGQRHPPPRHFTDRIHTVFCILCPALMEQSNVIPSDSRPSPRQDRYIVHHPSPSLIPQLDIGSNTLSRHSTETAGGELGKGPVPVPAATRAAVACQRYFVRYSVFCTSSPVDLVLSLQRVLSA